MSGASPVVPTPARPLTVVQGEVLAMIYEGLTDGAIAARLSCSVSTVRAHVRAIYARLPVHPALPERLEARAAVERYAVLVYTIRAA